MALHPHATLRGKVRTPDQAPPPGVLGAADEPAGTMAMTLHMSDFVPAQPPVEVDMAPPSGAPAVLGAPAAAEEAEVAMLEFQPDPEEGAVYALVHEIQTPEGTIYDVCLPESGIRGAVLGTAAEGVVPGMLRFPVRRMIDGSAPDEPTAPSPGVLGVGDLITELPGVKHVLQVVKAPVERALTQYIESLEGAPQVLSVAGGSFDTPLEGAEAWRARFTPGKEYTVLLFIHGFNSDVGTTFNSQWVEAFASRYDAAFGYNHPTFTRDPLENAIRLLEMIPDDVRLNVDIMAHSRGGLVTRSLVELQEMTPKFNIQRLITFGSPHGGTLLADHEHWDRLISIGFTTISWLTRASGAGTLISFLPKGLEFLLRAGSQFVFDLPGVNAMDPDSDFLKKLNAPGDLAQRVRYAAVTSDFNPHMVEQRSFRQSLTAMAAQVFLRTPNDLVVPTPSMSHIDPDASPLGGRIYQANINHFMYFTRGDVQDFTNEYLAQ
jgi:pimeloyl-ACP methyl ester carboxylesterase